MIALTGVGLAKTIIQGFYETYTSLSDSDKFALILERNYSNYGSHGMGEYYHGQKIKTVEDAVAYCKSKVEARGTHKQADAAVALSVTGVSTAVGGFGGSVVPVAGTAAGAAVGAGIGFGISKAVVYGWRGAKKFKKFCCRTLGVHRKEAAEVLVEMLLKRPQASDEYMNDFKAATEALVVLLGEKRLQYWIDGGMGSGCYDEDMWKEEVVASLSSWR